MLGLENFGFRALWSPYFIIFIVLVGAAYWYATERARHKFADSDLVPKKQKFYFYMGLFLVYVAQGSPLDLAGHLMFSFHMASMSIAFIIAVPLILLGLPGWLIRPLIDRILASKLKIMLHPIVTLLSFNVLFSFYHYPDVHDAIMTNYALHFIYYVILYIAAFMMWWPIAGQLQEYVQMTGLKKIGYMFANGALMTPACALIIFAGTPVFATYNDPMVWVKALGFCVPGDPMVLLKMFEGPEFFSLMSPIHDQQLGGVIMKLVQEFVYGGILYSIFKTWFRSENRGDDPIERQDESEFHLSPTQLNRA